MKRIFPVFLAALVLMGAGCSSDLETRTDSSSTTAETTETASGYVGSYAQADGPLYGTTAADFGADISVQVPEEVSEGQSYEIRVNVENITEDEIFLHSIDIGNTYLNAAKVLDAIPSYSTTLYLDIDDTTSHFFEVPIAAGGSQDIVFEMYADATGMHSGDFDVCFNEGGDCAFYKINTRIE